MAISILLVDDHAVFRDGVRMLLQSISDFSIVGEAGNGMDALSLIQDRRPDVVVLDWVMPGLSGLEVLQQMKKKGLDTHVIIVSMYTDETYVTSAFKHNAYGYVAKDDIAAHLANAIRSVAAGNRYVSPLLNN